MSRSDDLLPPLVEELTPAPDPASAFRALSHLPHAVFFDSAMRHSELGRYSYLAADPFDWIIVPADGSPALAELRRRLEPFCAARADGLPPWQGGAAGVLGYEIGRSLERLPSPRWDEFQTPALAMGLYSIVVAFDHEQNRAWIISQGIPTRDDAERRLEVFQDVLESSATPRAPRSPSILQPNELSPCFEENGVLSDFSRDGYLQAVRRAVGHLRAGDAYQVNLSQRLLAPDPGDPVEMYFRLREKNPAPFAGYFDAGEWQLASASPERFLHLRDDSVETRPIKGTRPRGVDPAEDTRFGAELTGSEKDRAENVMIVDLLRNDLSRVCEDASVEVATLFGLEKYAHVQHLVSVVSGRLRRDCDAVDLLAATLPGGSVTGAPKVRAQQLIAELEPTARGAYCGALAWIGFADEAGHQAMDSSVLIRSLVRARGWVQASVGGGVVVQSDPEREYAETWDKAKGLIDSIAS